MQAVSLGMETLDVAHLHGQAISKLLEAGSPPGVPPHPAKTFFEETIIPIEQTHAPALQADARMTKLTQSLRQRTKEATESSRLLGKGVARRQTAEADLDKSIRARAGGMVEAQRLQKHLQKLTHDILEAQEHERKNTGQQLRDDIAQLLLAIQIRLLALNSAVMSNSENLKKEIAETQRIVKQSKKSIHQLSPGTKVHHEA